jgi:two-component system, OmpR family, response regulator
MRILVIEDDEKIASFVIKGLQQAGMAVDHASNGEDGLDLFLGTTYDAAIVDVMLPGLDGVTLIQKARARKIGTPVIVLSAKRSVDDRVSGLHSGADDYLVKPFAFSELLARVQALVRRFSGTPETVRLALADLTLDLLTREVRRADQLIDLQPREFSLLEYLMRNSGRPVSKTMILERVWDYSFDPQTNVVDVLVCRLRNKIDKDFGEKLIHTIRGVGYVLKRP